jgi:hypothetical protein
MSWSVTAPKTGDSSSSATSYMITSLSAPAGTLVAVAGAIKGPTGGTMTGVGIADSAGNAWSMHYVLGHTNREFAFIAWAVLASTWASATITISSIGTGNMTSYAATVLKASGGGTTEDTAVLTSASGSSASPSNTGNAATRQGALLIALTAFWPTTTSTYTEDTVDGWTNLENDLTVGSANVATSVAYQVNTGKSGITHAPTLGTSSDWLEMMIGFDIPLVALTGQGSVATAGIGAGAFSAAIAAKCAGMTGGRGSASFTAQMSARSTSTTRGRCSGAYSTALSGRTATQSKGRVVGGFAAAVAGRTAAMTKGTASGAYGAALSARTAMHSKGRASASFAAAVAACAVLAMRGAVGASFLARLAGRLLAAMKGAAGLSPGSAAFDPGYALLAPPRCDAVLAPSPREALLAPAVIEAFLTE